MEYTINKVAKLAGITQRTLRYYDKIKLLCPSGRSEAGYRLYSDGDIERLQQILFFRELDFSLAKISQIINNPTFDPLQALTMQIEYLNERAKRYQNLSVLAKKTLSNLKGEIKMSNKDLFDDFKYEKIKEHQKKYEKEVEERWGDTDAYKISNERASKYTKEDWAKIQRETGENLNELIACFNEKVPYDDPRMMAVCDKARENITKFFYPCSLEIYSGLGNMYVSDERFTEYYDKFATGLAKYYNDAIQNYCIINTK